VSGAVEDAAVVARCRAGDADAWRELVERHSRYVYAIATRAFDLTPDEAEDVFQEAFTRTYVHLSSLREDIAIRPWLAQVTRRLAIDRIRARARVELDEDVQRLGDEGARSIEQIDAAIDVHLAMGALPAGCREILDRFFARDESYRTIAAALDLPMGTVASRLARCIKKLREQLEGKNSGRSPVV
jgi:RNA polymerase sigma factor (sigma-70 family)